MPAVIRIGSAINQTANLVGVFVHDRQQESRTSVRIVVHLVFESVEAFPIEPRSKGEQQREQDRDVLDAKRVERRRSGTPFHNQARSKITMSQTPPTTRHHVRWAHSSSCETDKLISPTELSNNCLSTRSPSGV